MTTVTEAPAVKPVRAKRAAPAKAQEPVVREFISRNGNDVYSVAGFFAEYDWWVNELSMRNGWCDRNYAYELIMSKVRGVGQPPMIIPGPFNTDRVALTTPPVPLDELNEKGLAKWHESQYGLIDKLRATAIWYAAGAVKSSESGTGFTLTLEDANRMLNALGIPALKRVQTTSYIYRDSVEFSVPEALNDNRLALKNKIHEAIKAIIAETPGAVVKEINNSELGIGTRKSRFLPAEEVLILVPPPAEA